MVSMGGFCHAQTIDLSKDPKNSTPTHKKSNAQILSDTEKKPTKENEVYTPAPDAANGNTNGTYNQHLQVTPTPNNANLTTEPSMMKTQQQQGKIGNMNTNSTIYYDNSGKIRSSSTTIKLGNKNK